MDGQEIADGLVPPGTNRNRCPALDRHCHMLEGRVAANGAGPAMTGRFEVSYRDGILIVLVAGVFWSLSALAIRLVNDAATWQILFYRSAGLIPVLFLFISVRSGGRPLAEIRRAGRPAVVGGAGLVAAFAGAVYSIQETTVANAVFLFATAPFFTAILAWPVLGERVGRRTWIATAVGFTGVVIMVEDGIAQGAILGNLAAVISAIGFAVFTLSLRRGRSADMAAAVLLAGLMSLPVSFMMCQILDQTLFIAPRDIVICLLMGAVLLACGLSIYIIGSRAVPAAELALLAMTEVLLGPIWVWLFLGETAAFQTWAGGAVLMAAIAGNALSGLRGLQPRPI